MKQHSTTAIVLLLVSAALLPLQGVAGLLGEEDLSVRTGVTVRSWSMEVEGNELDVSQVTLPILVRVPVGAEKMHFSLYTSGISSDVKGDEEISMSGASDTRLRLSWLMPNDRILLSGGFSLPTGPTDLDRDEVLVSRAISNQVLGFRANRYGEGFDLFAGLAAARPVNNNWSIGGGFGGRLKGSFDFAPEASNGLGEVEPGSEVFLSGGVSYHSRGDNRTTAFNTDLSYRTYGKDKVESKEVFEEGDEIDLVINGAIDGERWKEAFLLRLVSKGEHTLLGTASPITAETSLQKLVLANVTGDHYKVQGMVTYRLTTRLDLTGRLTYSHFSEVEVKREDGKKAVATRGDAGIVEPGLSAIRRFGDRFSLVTGFSLLSGSADGGKFDLSGYDIYLGTHFGL